MHKSESCDFLLFFLLLLTLSTFMAVWEIASFLFIILIFFFRLPTLLMSRKSTAET